MTNHYHSIETPEANLSRAIKWLNGSYATYVNTKGGHLFQGRFKSIIVEADEYLKYLSRYIYGKGKNQTPSDYQCITHLLEKRRHPNGLKRPCYHVLEKKELPKICRRYRCKGS